MVVDSSFYNKIKSGYRMSRPEHAPQDVYVTTDAGDCTAAVLSEAGRHFAVNSRHFGVCRAQPMVIHG